LYQNKSSTTTPQKKQIHPLTPAQNAIEQQATNNNGSPKILEKAPEEQQTKNTVRTAQFNSPSDLKTNQS
jgi:hypothetical protein